MIKKLTKYFAFATLLKNLIGAAYTNKSGKILYVVDEKGEIHSALFTIWNQLSSFNLINPILIPIRLL